MPKPAPPPLSLALTFLREAAGWSQKEVAAASGMSAALLSHYEQGRKRLGRELLERIAQRMGFAAEAVDLALFAAGGLRGTVEEMPGSPAYPSPAERQVAERAAARVGSTALTLTRGDILRRAREGRLARAEEAAERQWRVLASCTTAERRLLVERSVEFRNWALGVRLGEESTRAAAQNVGLALELAGLALRAAELAAGDEAWRNRLAGRARGFVGNALRVKGRLRAAEAEFGIAWKLWEAGAAGDPDRILPEWRLPDLEASLRRDLREFGTALALLDRALTIAPPEAAGRILLNRAHTLEQAGDVAGSVSALRQAAPLLRRGGDRRLHFGLEFNLGVNLCHLGRFGEAERRMPELRRLSAGLGNRIDAAKVRWLSGRVAAGLGCRDEARAAFEQARDAFATSEKAYDTALVSLDLAVLLLEEGDTAAVRELAVMMGWVFQGEAIERESLAALRLFCEAALQERATLEETRSILTMVKQAGGRL
jgi:transcriptional regulator with XRE-family HTH domain